MIVDIHPHIVSNDVERYPLTPFGGKRSNWSHERSVTAEEMIAAMDEAGVDKCAMVHSTTTYGFNCDYVADTVAANPKRMTGVFTINPIEPDGPEKMRYWFSRGCTGMRIFSRGSTISGTWMEIDDPRVFPCYEVAEELNIPVATNITVAQFSQLEPVLKRFPGVNLVLDHLGSTDFSDGPPFSNAAPLLNLARYPNLYLKVASKNFKETATKDKATPETVFGRLIEEFGSDRMAWASNYPATAGTLKELLDTARRTVSFLPQSDQDWIFGKTALKLYPALAGN